MSRCLILSCTQLKNEAKGQLPAIERYNGPTFRVLRKFLRDAPPVVRDVNVYVLSAQYGMISGTTLTEYYDLRMTTTRALELRDAVLDKLVNVFSNDFEDTLILLGRDYLQAIEGFEAMIPKATHITILNTTAGRQLSALKAWLYKTPSLAVIQPRLVEATGKATLRGHSLRTTSEEILALAREALAEQRGNPDNFRGWYALVDDRKVSTKWLVSLLFGVHVSEFDASEARRVLQQLGIEVYQDV